MAIDLYFAGSSMSEADDLIKSKSYNRLFSYLNDKKIIDNYVEYIRNTKSNLKLFIDSGAFTAWTKGNMIDVDEYINWINSRSDCIHLYGQIDFIPGDIVKGATNEQVKEAAQKTWENYLYMRPKMKNPDGLLYTFHVGEPYEYLKQALEWEDESGKPIYYIALGGMVGKPMPVKESFLDSCFEIIKNSSNPNVKIHAFGMTSFSLLKKYPITSADSTSWIMTGANGSIMTDCGIIQVSDNKSNLPNHYSHLDKQHIEIFNTKIKDFGYSLKELAVDYKKRELLNIEYMYKKSKELQYKPKQKTYKLF